jgi:5-methylcytosine-specific restriction endonuclease McrA
MLAESAYPALVLNADFRPLQTSPLSVMSWQDAVRASLSTGFTVVDTYDVKVRSPTTEIPLPSVLAVQNFVNLDRPAALTRWNLFLAHRFRCAYCASGERSELTFEHVIPRARGGQGVWTNLVPACVACNIRKADRTPSEAGMQLLSKPWHPTRLELNVIGKDFVDLEAANTKAWLSWFYWKGIELDP